MICSELNTNYVYPEISHMKEFKSLVKEYLRETLYEADIIMRSDRSKRLTIITDNLRGVCGITVVTIKEASKPVSSTVERTPLRVKFFLFGASLQEHVSKMQTEARKIDGIYSFIATRVDRVEDRIYHRSRTE